MKNVIAAASFFLIFSMTGDCPISAAQEAAQDASDIPMQHKHMDMGPHMYMTTPRAEKPGDQQQADRVLQAARKVMDQYRDYKAALRDGYGITFPNVPQKMYHFTNRDYALEARSTSFNPEHPTSLLYEKQGDGYTLIGVMYTASVVLSEDQLDKRIPLSVAQWHKHVNVCLPPPDKRDELLAKNRRFGFSGSIAAEDECDKAGGKFHPVIFGWMVHVYPDGKTPEEIWSVERQHDNHAGQ
jgi:hypothetical protein